MTRPNATPILLLDGGLGTTLSEAPYRIVYDESTPLWSSHLLISSPETLKAVHQDFVNAGADIVLTATYQASHEGFARTPRLSQNHHSYSKDEAARYMRSAVDLVADVTTRHDYTSSVALSLGAYGAILSPSQEFSGVYPETMSNQSALANWHLDRIEIFKSVPDTWNKIGYLAFETVRPIAEIHGIRTAMHGIDKKWWISHVVPDEVHESKIPDIVTAMLEEQNGLARPWGIGVNCTAVQKVADIVQEYSHTVTTKFPELAGQLWLVVYPDGTRGEVYDSKSMTWVKSSTCSLKEDWENIVIHIVKQAALSKIWRGIIVGGCCKTLPKDIHQLRKRIDSL